ncbi:hypothetical protein TW95_gp1368 [Pandoravirus inopinatum]|uniref:Transmembrane protein n=1 Tax=Pandoravirus inopinatum TaxID=1605721 RepID=A0A0B5JEA5_9VIRU|nr:hypothetical protein TW95_gp1368 [Pandoravirus inopinatum]AJF98102.1 hypothetical protein [Pandoravirus inopinatum]
MPVLFFSTWSTFWYTHTGTQPERCFSVPFLDSLGKKAVGNKRKEKKGKRHGEAQGTARTQCGLVYFLASFLPRSTRMGLATNFVAQCAGLFFSLFYFFLGFSVGAHI